MPPPNLHMIDMRVCMYAFVCMRVLGYMHALHNIDILLIDVIQKRINNLGL